MKIYLNPEVASGLGEDTFWMWFKREFPNSEFLSPNSSKIFNFAHTYNCKEYYFF